MSYTLIDKNLEDQNRKNITDAIRSKVGINKKLIWPDQIVQTINDIQTEKPEQSKTVEILQNGDTVIIPDQGKVLSKVIASVNISIGGVDTFPFSRIDILEWTPTVDTQYYHVDDQKDLAFVGLFMKGADLGRSGIHSIFVITDPNYKLVQNGLAMGSWSGQSWGVVDGLAAYGYPQPGDLGDDNGTLYYKTNATYTVILGYGPLP